MKNAAGSFVDAVARVGDRRRGRDQARQRHRFPGLHHERAGRRRRTPIASFTWLLVKKDTKDAAKAKLVRDFLAWMITPDAQKMASDLHYAQLPAEVVSLIQTRLPTLKAAGKTIALN